MRQPNQNKRMRGRGRKGPNLLSRSFESNGPDVKVRGTAMHIAEKYQQLARDAQAAGDRIMAESYYQHAEHYSRIVAAAQQQNGSSDSRDDDRGHDAGHDRDAGGEAEVPAPKPQAKAKEPAADVMPEDAPQPFIDNMPSTNTKRANGSARKASKPAEEAEASDADKDAGEDGSKPRRRTRGTRGRGARRAAPVGDGGEGEASSDKPAEAVAEA